MEFGEIIVGIGGIILEFGEINTKFGGILKSSALRYKKMKLPDSFFVNKG